MTKKHALWFVLRPTIGLQVSIARSSNVTAGVLVCLGIISCGKANTPNTEGTGGDRSGTGSPNMPGRPDPYLSSEYTSVTRTFGALTVREGVYESEASTLPWASYYFASSDPVLFQDAQSSALAKYDRYVLATRGSASHARDKEEVLYNHSGRFAEPWQGLCNAWSYAAISYPEPKSKVVKGISFSTGELKGLLIKTLETADPLVHFGIKFREAPGANFDSMFPDQFHRFLQVQLFEQRHAFVMDKSPGLEVWNYPAYYAKTDIRVSPTDPSRMNVRTLVLAAEILTASQKDWSEVDHGHLFSAFDYTYDLVGSRKADGSFDVFFGEWTGQARYAHPDYVIPMPQQLLRKSLNSEIDTQVVDEILSSRADF